MNPSDFIRKWRDVALTERSACQQHFLDLCKLVEHPSPTDMDMKGDFFTFEKGVEKTGGGDGWADVWKRGFFGWEYKGPRANLFKAYEQLLRYREALENPPLLVVCDMNIIEIHTNFTGTAPVVYTIPLEEMSGPRNLEVLRAVFHDPEKLKPGVTSEVITAKAARHVGEIAQRLRERGEDAQQVAHFLDRIVFCLFAEDIKLLQDDLFSRLLEKTRHDPERFHKAVGQLFEAMAAGGDFGMDTIRRFNGNLFEQGAILALGEEDLATLYEIARLNWSAVDPSIFGTLFERGLDPSKRAQLGAHYTSRQDIEVLVEPVILAPLRTEWAAARTEAESLLAKSEAKDGVGRSKYTDETVRKNRERAAGAVGAFLRHLSGVRVLDPACGSGNFLYVTLQKIKDLEKEAILWAADRRLDPPLPMVHPRQLYGIELNPYAHDLAQMTVWIGYLQWVRANGFGAPSDPILESLEGNFQNKDAILDLTGPKHPKEPDWPEVDFIVGNPPFLGGNRIRGELGDSYLNHLFTLYKGLVPPVADLCCYWFEKTREQVAAGKCKRAGLLATQGIRGGANREVLKRIKDTGDIFFAESDRPWILEGASVHVSMVGFDAGQECDRFLDGRSVTRINASLTNLADISGAMVLKEGSGISFKGPCPNAPFDIAEPLAREMIILCGVNGRPLADVVRPLLRAIDLTGRGTSRWTIDFGAMGIEEASKYEAAFEHCKQVIWSIRKGNRRESYANRWWQFGETRSGMRAALTGKTEFLVTPHHSKHRLFSRCGAETLANNSTFVFARSDDYFFGVLHSKIHEVWALALGTQLETRPRYTSTTCFKTFPFPWPLGQEPEKDPKVLAVATATLELDTLRKAWLNPPEWVKEEVLQFPGTINGPWAQYVTDPDARGIGTVNYPRLVPKDEPSAVLLKKRTLTALYNQRPTWLDLAHQRLDEAVATAYGWPPDLPEPELLQRLLDLNQVRAMAVESKKNE